MQNQKKRQLEKSGGRCGTDLDRDIDRHRHLDGSRVSVGKGTLKIAATQADRFVGPSAPMQAQHVQTRHTTQPGIFPKRQDTGTPYTLGFLHPRFPICELQNCSIQCALWSASWDPAGSRASLRCSGQTW